MTSEITEGASAIDISTDPVDAEGLAAHYDVVICGTGLVQSILASAIARYSSGKKILHLDGSDHYGNLDAVWTLPYLLSLGETREAARTCDEPIAVPQTEAYSDENQKMDSALKKEIVPLLSMGELSGLHFHSMMRNTAHGVIRMKKQVHTPYGTGRVRALQRSTEAIYSLEIELTNWTLANGTYPTLYLGIPPKVVMQDEEFGWWIDGTLMWNQYRIRTLTAHWASQILEQHSRSLALDVTPYLLYASGPAVDGLLLSSVSNYLEFKSLDAVLYYSKPNNISSSPKQSTPGTFTRVPCSKNDVFASQLLSPMDKRRLMKFLHLALDYAAATANSNTMDSEDHPDDTLKDATSSSVTEDLQTLNERRLNQGRSLMRPQNKAVASTELEHLQDLCRPREGCSPSFVSYLRDDQKLSPPLVALIRYALALDCSCDAEIDDTENVDTQRGSDGMIPTTSVAKGMEQLCSHMLALGQFGTTAFLVPLYGSGEMSQAFCRSAAVYGATYLLRRAPTAIVISGPKVCGIELSPTIDDEATPSSASFSAKQISCTHVVVPFCSIRDSKANSSRLIRSQRVLRRISILTGKPIQIDDSQQHQQQRHVLIMPPRSVSAKQTSAIHGVVVDEFVNVAPHVPFGCTIVPLTPTIGCSDEESCDDSLLSSAFDVIQRSFRSTENDEIAEIFHVSFSYDVSAPQEGETNETLDSLPKSDGGLHVVHRCRPGLTADSAFQQAAGIFQQIYPKSTASDFLKLSQATTEAIKASLGENALNNNDEDEETMALASAVEMIGKPKLDASTAGVNDA